MSKLTMHFIGWQANVAIAKYDSDKNTTTDTKAKVPAKYDSDENATDTKATVP